MTNKTQNTGNENANVDAIILTQRAPAEGDKPLQTQGGKTK